MADRKVPARYAASHAHARAADALARNAADARARRAAAAAQVAGDHGTRRRAYSNHAPPLPWIGSTHHTALSSLRAQQPPGWAEVSCRRTTRHGAAGRVAPPGCACGLSITAGPPPDVAGAGTPTSHPPQGRHAPAEYAPVDAQNSPSYMHGSHVRSWGANKPSYDVAIYLESRV